MIAPPPFTPEDFGRANDQWGANCGPGALAAIMMMTLDHVRPHMGDFERKGYTNPTLMLDALRSIGRPWRMGAASWPRHGLVRIQWHGPWMKPGVPIGVRYRHSHWVAAAADLRFGYGVFDINAMGNGSGWCRRADWEAIVAPWIIKECVPRGDGTWSITHGIEVGA